MNRKTLTIENPVRLTEHDFRPIRIAEFYAGETVLITGVTGFIGKVFLDILLRKIPSIRFVYVLIRPLKNKSAEARFRDLLNLALFDRLRVECPEAIEKVIVFAGDVSEPNLGLSESNRRHLIDNVNYVFHGAASVRFDDSLKKAILMNTRGTLEIVRLCREIRNLKCLTYISTAYCNTDYDVIEEQVYPAKADWRAILKMIETIDENHLDILTSLITNELPNTYSFSKSLAESILDEFASELPIVIVRPSVVICTYREPVAGWVDNINGPMGMVLGVTKGVLHVMHGDKNIFADYTSADLVVSTLFAATVCRCQLTLDKCLVVNVTTSNTLIVTNAKILEIGLLMGKNYPLETIMWYPSCCFAKSMLVYYVLFVFLHIIPAIFVDLVLRYKGEKLRLMKVYRKVFFANLALKKYMMRNWIFRNDNFLNLQKLLIGSDRVEFQLDFSDVSIERFMVNGMFGVKQYLMKESSDFDDRLPQNRRNLQRMFYIHVTFLLTVTVCCLWLLQKLHVFDYIKQKTVLWQI